MMISGNIYIGDIIQVINPHSVAHLKLRHYLSKGQALTAYIDKELEIVLPLFVFHEKIDT